MQKIKCLKDEYTYYGLEKCLAPDETPEMAEGLDHTVFEKRLEKIEEVLA